MAKKIMAVITLLAFTLFSTSWMVYRIRQESIETAAKKGEKATLLGVQTKSREYLEFREGSPARIQADAVRGEILKTVEFNRADIAQKIDPAGGKLGEVLTKEGKQFRFLTARAAGPIGGPAFESRAHFSTLNKSRAESPRPPLSDE